MCRNPVIQKIFVFLGIGEKGGTDTDVIAKDGRTMAGAYRQLKKRVILTESKLALS